MYASHNAVLRTKKYTEVMKRDSLKEAKNQIITPT